MRLRLVLFHPLYEAGDNVSGVCYSKLSEEEAEFVFVSLCQPRLVLRRQIPESLLEWPESLLARLVKELFVRVRRLPLVLGILSKPIVDLDAQTVRDVIV